MAAPIKKPLIPAEVVRDPSVMGGHPVVRGTRILADTILIYLREGHSPREIFEDSRAWIAEHGIIEGNDLGAKAYDNAGVRLTA